MCVCFIFESAKNTQLIDSKNKQVLPSTRDESSIHPEYSGALVCFFRLISSYNTAHCKFFSRPSVLPFYKMHHILRYYSTNIQCFIY